MRFMERERLIAIAPFALVAALAAGVALAGFVASPHARIESVGTSTSSAPASAAQTSVAESASPEPKASPSSAPSAAATSSGPKSNDAGAMLRVHNELRAAIGAPAVRGDDRVTAAAQHHAEYLARAGIIGHDETAGEPGFTGASGRDRLAPPGYTDATASEVAASSDTGTEDVRFLWDLPYHRLGLMHPHATVAGWGHAEIGGHTATVGVIVFDFTPAALERVRSPAAGQRVTGSWAGEESPDALPAGASRPVGYPVMVVYANAARVDLRSAKLTDASGRDTAVSVVPQIYERDFVAVVPTAPLAAGATFRVRLELSVNGSDVVEEWEFETER